MRRVSRFIALSIAIVVLAVACGSGSGSSDGAASNARLARISSAADEVADASTGRFSMDLAYEGLPDPGGVAISGEGEYDLDNEASRFTMDMVAMLEGAPGVPPEFDGSIETITMGSTIYMSGSFFGAIPGLDAEWISFDLEQAAEEAGLDGIDLDSLMQNQGVDPSATLDQLKALDSIEEVGTEEVRGVATTHYTGEVRLGDAFDELDETQRDAVAGLYGGDLDAAADMVVPFDVWVDEDGLVRRIVQSISGDDLAAAIESGGLEDADKVEGGSITTTVEYFDIGADISIEAPADAVDLSELMSATFDFEHMIPGAGEN